MASGPTTSWEIDGETVETVSDFIFWGSKITADGDCSHEVKYDLGRVKNGDMRHNQINTISSTVESSVQLHSHVRPFATPWTAAKENGGD